MKALKIIGLIAFGIYAFVLTVSRGYSFFLFYMLAEYPWYFKVIDFVLTLIGIILLYLVCKYIKTIAEKEN